MLPRLFIIFYSSLRCIPLSLNVVAVTAPQTGEKVFGSRQKRMIDSFLIAVVKLPVSSAASGTIPPTSTRWRLVHLSRWLRATLKLKQDYNFFPSLCCQGGCILKLEDFILSQLYILGALGIGIAFLQVKSQPLKLK